MEGRVAQWVDLGTMPYQECYALQLELVKLRQRGAIGDMILAVQHPTEVNFGNDTANNQFSDEEQHLILSNAMDILLDKLEIDGDEFEDFEGEVDWSRFDDIIGYYMDTIIKQPKRIKHRCLKC